jgi:hypothetical protein
MLRSLHRHNPDAHVYVFAFDERTLNLLQRLALAYVTPVSLREFEDDDLLRVKPTRSKGEYCWTATSSTILYAISRFSLSACTYIDADLYFYADPAILLDELGDQSVLITDHRYTPEYDQSAVSGKYCVQFTTFRNDEAGMRALQWWRDACIEWCFDRVEPGRFGDQKYLDDWTTRFAGVHVLEHRGGGLAPWNIQQYALRPSDGRIVGKELQTGKTFNPVFYHYHHTRWYDDGIIDLGPYRLTPEVIDLFYKPYLRDLEASKSILRTLDESFDPHGVRKRDKSWKAPLRAAKQKLQGRYNLFPAVELLS